MNPENRKPLEVVIMATSSGCWGKGATLEEAKRNCLKAGGKGKVAFVLLPKGTEISGAHVSYPTDAKFIATELGKL